MFHTILIANRGEIALRILRTARAMGIRCIAVHSAADRDALHVAMADHAVEIGGNAPADSYLRGDRIIAAALATGAQAIHPGYGFLSENPDFVDAVEAAGLAFIGPSVAAIRAMGLKDAAKDLMARAGVPVVPGYQGETQDPAHLEAAALDIGFPLLVKAVAGGGGKGMRLVERRADFADALAAARAEAQNAFGNPRVLLERYIQRPRHIEVQVFGDGTRALHLFERDCSLQRRHQKVIEEAPAPGMTGEMRAAMGAAAVRAAEAIGYKGAGTVEFIVGTADGLRPDGFWFMEMNTRLQVEHPVTEAITGVDLVEWQLRVAAGEGLPLRQDQLAINGHAFEARLYAEDVAAGFLPATGRLRHLRFPQGVRVETGVRAGDQISPWYDPMIAKIITHGPTRDIALGNLSAALARTEVGGTVTNLGFLGALARHPAFVRGEVDTGLIARSGAELAVPAQPTAQDWAQAAMALSGLAPGQGFTLWDPLPRRVVLSQGDTEVAITLTLDGARAQIALSDGARLTALWREGWWIEGAAPPRAEVHAEGVSLYRALGPMEFHSPDPLAVDLASGASNGAVLAPMPGLVKALFVAAGDHVEKGARLAILEAMKMEHALVAPHAGVVAEVMAGPGAQVEAGAALVLLHEGAAG